jgi:hypothetical protein
MCFSEAKWKREQIPDHKFDFVDVEDFVDPSCVRRFLYLTVFLVVLKSILVIVADLWTMVLLLVQKGWSSAITPPNISLTVSKWVFVGSIAASFLLLFIEFTKTRRVIRSRDIAYGFTCIGAYRYYCVRSYAHYCLFNKINNNQSFTEKVAFFCFFVLKGWKRFLFAEAPRQVINAFTLAGVYFGSGSFRPQQFWEFSDNWTERATVGLMTFSFVIWALTALRLLFAFCLYIPLLCVIRGNLKEYCCHKIDKRISEMLRKRSRARILQEQAERTRLEKELASVGGHQQLHATLPMMGDFDPESLPIHEEKVMLEAPGAPSMGRASPTLPPRVSPVLSPQSIGDGYGQRPVTPQRYASTSPVPQYAQPFTPGHVQQGVMLPVGFPVNTTMQPIYEITHAPAYGVPRTSYDYQPSSTAPTTSGSHVSYQPTQVSYPVTPQVFHTPAPPTNTTLPPYSHAPPYSQAPPSPHIAPQEGEERYAPGGSKLKRWND